MFPFNYHGNGKAQALDLADLTLQTCSLCWGFRSSGSTAVCLHLSQRQVVDDLPWSISLFWGTRGSPRPCGCRDQRWALCLGHQSSMPVWWSCQQVPTWVLQAPPSPWGCLSTFLQIGGVGLGCWGMWLWIQTPSLGDPMGESRSCQGSQPCWKPTSPDMWYSLGWWEWALIYAMEWHPRRGSRAPVSMSVGELWGSAESPGPKEWPGPLHWRWGMKKLGHEERSNILGPETRGG